MGPFRRMVDTKMARGRWCVGGERLMLGCDGEKEENLSLLEGVTRML